jgi:hypothetical protein
MTKVADKEAGLVKPPPSLFKLVTEIAQGVLAHYVLHNVYSSIVMDSEIEYLEDVAKDINQFLRNYDQEDMEEVFESLDDFRMEFYDIHRSIINDYVDRSNHEEAMEEATYVKELTEDILGVLKFGDKVWTLPSSEETYRKLREREGDVEIIASYLTSIVRALRDKKNSTPYRHKDKFEEALAQFPREYLTSKNIHLNLGAKAEVTHHEFQFPIALKFVFQYGDLLGSHKLDHRKNLSRHRIKITIPEKRKYSKHDLDDVKDTVRHELVHAVQEEIGFREMLVERGGLPSAKRDKRFMQHDVEGERRLRKEFEDLGLDSSVVDFHALDDVEFYTRLLDEVVEFQKKIPNPSNDDIRKFISRRQFFISLKRFKRKNWSKAVGIFISEVQSNSRKASEK